MRRLTVTLAALALVAVTLARPADATSACPPAHAWAGSETTNQGGGTLLDIPVSAPMTLTRVVVTISFAQRDNTAPGFAEVLTLVGVTHGPVVMDGAWPVLTPSPDFGANVVTTTDGSTHNENPHLSDAVLGSSIVKTRTGYGFDRIDVSTSLDLAPGDHVWINYDSLSSPHVSLDPEVQADVTYVPVTCS